MVARAPRKSVRSDIEWIGERRVPWRGENPLLFHRLSSMDVDRPGAERRRFLRLMESGACLAPAVERGGADRGHGIRDIDELAGDARYLFLTVGRPFDAVDVYLLPTDPAVAFTLEALLVDRPLGPAMDRFLSHDQHLGWRPHDLIACLSG